MQSAVNQAETDKRRQDTASAKFLQRPEVKQAVLKIEVRGETKRAKRASSLSSPLPSFLVDGSICQSSHVLFRLFNIKRA